MFEAGEKSFDSFGSHQFAIKIYSGVAGNGYKSTACKISHTIIAARKILHRNSATDEDLHTNNTTNGTRHRNDCIGKISAGAGGLLRLTYVVNSHVAQG